MKILTVVILIFIVTTQQIFSDSIKSANSNDYIDCAAFYMSVLEVSKYMSNEYVKIEEELTGRINFYLKTAAIYDNIKELTPQMKQMYLDKSNEFTKNAHKMLQGKNKMEYPHYVDRRMEECKDMLNINYKRLLQNQGLKID